MLCVIFDGGLHTVEQAARRSSQQTCSAAYRLSAVCHTSQDVAEACMRPGPTARPMFSKLVTDLTALLEAANAGTMQVREPSVRVCRVTDPHASPPAAAAVRACAARM